MPVPVIMPKLSMTMEQGVIVSWFKEEGSRVEKGEPLLEVSTDKVNFEVESPASGVLARITARPGDQVAVTETIALIVQPGEDVGGLPEAAPAAPAAAVEPAVEPAVSVAPTRPRATPAARRAAREAGVDLSSVSGTGPGGAVTRADVSTAVSQAAAPATAQTADRVLPYQGMRRAIGDKMSLSVRTAPQLAMSALVDLTAAAGLLARLSPRVESSGGPKLTYTDILVKCVAAALREHPKVNSSLREDGIHVMADVNVGIAVALPDGLIVPVLKKADEKGMAAIARERASLVEAARKGTLTPEDVSGGTFTISNIGRRDVEWFAPIINAPEAAILGVGKIAPRPIVQAGQVVAGLSAYLTLVFDHRVLDGADAADFLQTLKGLVEEPALLLA